MRATLDLKTDHDITISINYKDAQLITDALDEMFTKENDRALETGSPGAKGNALQLNAMRRIIRYQMRRLNGLDV